MEGNECYKFSTVANYVTMTSAKPIRVAIDVGCNLGTVTVMMRQFFPQAFIFAFEPVEVYYLHSCTALASDPFVKVLPSAVCAAHLFEDDIGERPRLKPEPLQVFKGLPQSGPGWVGGSHVLPASADGFDPGCYRREDIVPAMTLDQVVSMACEVTGEQVIDYIKMDCEGCECSSLGCALLSTLERIRFIGGEYHDISRFYKVMRAKLFQTHYVNLIGGAAQGSFFCERKGEQQTILKPTRDGMLIQRPWLADHLLDWHTFRDEFVRPEDRGFHAM